MTKMKWAMAAGLLSLTCDARAHGGVAGAMEAVKYLFMVFLAMVGIVLISAGFIAMRRERWFPEADPKRDLRTVFLVSSVVFLVPAFGISRDGAAIFGLFFARDLLHTILIVISLSLVSLNVLWLGVSKSTKLWLFSALSVLIIADAITTPEVVKFRTYRFIETAPLQNPVVISEVFDQQLGLLDNGWLVYSEEENRGLNGARGEAFSAILQRETEGAASVRLLGWRESSQYRRAVVRSRKASLVSLDLIEEEINRYAQYELGNFSVLDRSWSLELLPDNLSVHGQIACCHPEWVAQAVELGMDVNEPTRYFGGLAPLQYIARLRPDYQTRKDIRMIAESLIARDASLDVLDAQDASLLHHAAKSDNGSLVAQLLDAGAELHHVDNTGATALHYAARNEDGHGQAIDVLLRAGADVTARNSSGDTPLHDAAKHGGYGPVLALLKGDPDLNATNHQGLTPLHQAAGNAPTAVVKELLERGAIPTLKDQMGNSPLHYAIERPHTLEVLLAGGADAGIRNRRGQTAFELATAKFGDVRDRWPYRKVFEVLANSAAAIDP